MSCIEIMHTIAKGQMNRTGKNQTLRNLPVLLVGDISYPHYIEFVRLNRLTATEPCAGHRRDQTSTQRNAAFAQPLRTNPCPGSFHSQASMHIQQTIPQRCGKCQYPYYRVAARIASYPGTFAQSPQ